MERAVAAMVVARVEVLGAEVQAVAWVGAERAVAVRVAAVAVWKVAAARAEG